MKRAAALILLAIMIGCDHKPSSDASDERPVPAFPSCIGVDEPSREVGVYQAGGGSDLLLAIEQVQQRRRANLP